MFCRSFLLQNEIKLYRIFDLDTLSDILEYTDEEMAVTYLEEMSLKKAAAILSRTETNILAEILQHFDKEKRRLLIELLDDEARHDIEMINSFDEEEIGSPDDHQLYRDPGSSFCEGSHECPGIPGSSE